MCCARSATTNECTSKDPSRRSSNPASDSTPHLPRTSEAIGAAARARPGSIRQWLECLLAGLRDGDRGVLYAITADGELRWYRHDGWFNGAKVWTAGDGGRLVGTDWNRFERVLPAADGVIYGITGEGELHWHRHTGWADGTDGWHPHSGARVGNGWNILKTAFAMPGSDGTRPAPSPVQLALLSKHGPV